jgi:hypothetical protein
LANSWSVPLIIFKVSFIYIPIFKSYLSNSWLKIFGNIANILSNLLLFNRL